MLRPVGDAGAVQRRRSSEHQSRKNFGKKESLSARTTSPGVWAKLQARCRKLASLRGQLCGDSVPSSEIPRAAHMEITKPMVSRDSGVRAAQAIILGGGLAVGERAEGPGLSMAASSVGTHVSG